MNNIFLLDFFKYLSLADAEKNNLMFRSDFMN